MSDDSAEKIRQLPLGLTTVEWIMLTLAAIGAAVLSVMWVPITGVGFKWGEFIVVFPYPSGLYVLGPVAIWVSCRKKKREPSKEGTAA